MWLWRPDDLSSIAALDLLNAPIAARAAKMIPHEGDEFRSMFPGRVWKDLVHVTEAMDVKENEDPHLPTMPFVAFGICILAPRRIFPRICATFQESSEPRWRVPSNRRPSISSASVVPTPKSTPCAYQTPHPTGGFSHASTPSILRHPTPIYKDKRC